VEEARRLLSRHKRAIGERAIVPVRADLGDRGVYYRLQVGPFPDRAKAVQLCRKLSARRQSCLLVKP
jgi:cell division septation protein DedD